MVDRFEVEPCRGGPVTGHGEDDDAAHQVLPAVDPPTPHLPLRPHRVTHLVGAEHLRGDVGNGGEDLGPVAPDLVLPLPRAGCAGVSLR